VGIGYIVQRPLWKVTPDLLDLHKQGEKGSRFISPSLRRMEEASGLRAGEIGEIRRIGRDVK
jgi:hypothetical protein